MYCDSSVTPGFNHRVRSRAISVFLINEWWEWDIFIFFFFLLIGINNIYWCKVTDWYKYISYIILFHFCCDCYMLKYHNLCIAKYRMSLCATFKQIRGKIWLFVKTIQIFIKCNNYTLIHVIGTKISLKYT